MNSTKSILSVIPDVYRDALFDEYNKLLRNFRENRWEPLELNGGKFCEIVYSILECHINSRFLAGPLKPSNMVDACKKLENASNFPRSIRIQIPRMLVALYEIRNNRNVGHVGADVNPNYMDSTLVIQSVKWILAELIRVFHNVSIDEATKIVNSITDRSLPLIWKTESFTKILSNTLNARDKMFVLLYSENKPLSLKNICYTLEYSNITQFKTKVITPAHKEILVHYDSKLNTVQLTPIGQRYVEQNIALEI